jgi:glycosyltransferase involved in cell wall biosynthesis
MKKTLHVLFTGLVQPKVLSGGDQLFLDIGPRLPRDIQIIIIAPQVAHEHIIKIKQKNITCIYIKKNIFDFKDNPIAIFLSYVIRSWQVYRVLRKEKIQKIYSCSDIAYADIWPAYFIRRANPNIKWLTRIYHVLLPPENRQGNYIVNVIAFRLQRLSFWMMKRQSTTVFALNQKLYKEVKLLGFQKRNLSVLGAGIDYDLISKHKINKKYPYDVVALGRIAPIKGVFDTVKIWKKVHDANPELQLAWIGKGGDSYHKKLVQQLKVNDLTDSFHLLGFVDKEKAYDVLKSAKVFICPDHENGWGLAVCEAMSSGLPVVSYDLDIFGGVYKKGYKSVKLFDTNAFARELSSLLKNTEIRKSISKDASLQAKEFDHKQIIDTLTKYIN